MINLIPLPYKVGALALLVLAVAGFGYSKGSESVQRKWDAQKVADVLTIAADKDSRREISEAIDARSVKADAKIRALSSAITKGVPVYVDKASDSACIVPNGFVLIHDAAAIGAIPKAPGDTDGSASGVEISTVAETVTENYGAYAETRQRLIDLQDWVKQQGGLNGDGK